jgi:hypothetical protein
MVMIHNMAIPSVENALHIIVHNSKWLKCAKRGIHRHFSVLHARLAMEMILLTGNR